MKVLITGGTGFVGSHLKKLIPDAICSTRDLNNLLDKDALKKLFEENDFDVIYHLAAINSGFSYKPSNIDQFNANVIATKNLIDAIEAYSKKKPVIVLLSSIHVYDFSVGQEVSEVTPLGPKSFYGFTKLSQEELVLEAARKGFLKAVILRSSHMYGPNCKPNYNSSISTLCYEMIQDKKIKLTGSGKHTLNLVYIDDILKILIQSAQIATDEPQIYNLASDKSVTMLDVLKVLLDIQHKNANYEIIEGAANQSIISNIKLAEKYNYTSWTPLEVGLRKTYESLL